MPHIDDSTLWDTLPSPAPSATAANRGIRCRCGMHDSAYHALQSCRPYCDSRTAPQRQQIAENAAGAVSRHMPLIDDSTLWDTLPSPPPSTTAANHGIRCRCGMPDSTHQAIQTLWDAFRFTHRSTTAANHGKRCRCGRNRLTPPSGSAAFWRYALRAIPPTPAARAPPVHEATGGYAFRRQHSLMARSVILTDGYSQFNTFSTISPTVEQKQGMAASVSDMKPREAIVAKSSRSGS